MTDLVTLESLLVGYHDLYFKILSQTLLILSPPTGKCILTLQTWVQTEKGMRRLWRRTKSKQREQWEDDQRGVNGAGY